MINRITNLPRNTKRAISLLSDLILLPTTLWLAFSLRLDTFYVPDSKVALVFAITTVVTILLFIRMGLYRAMIRFAGTQLVTTVFIGVSVSVLALAFFGLLFGAFLPRSVPFIYFGGALLAVGGTRFLMRAILNTEQRNGREKVIIYGAGAAGRQLATALSHSAEYHAVAFIDDDKRIQGSTVQGLRVYRARALRKLVPKTGTSIVLLAVTNATPHQRSVMIEFLSRFPVRVQTIPDFTELVSGIANIEEVRDVEVEELLGRDPVPPDQTLLDKRITNKIVMVTGAGGSIGSELCRQIMSRKPRLLILFELSEIALYTIENELTHIYGEGSALGFLGNVQDKNLLTEIMQRFQVQTFYHSAAYKHVHIVEYNLIMGVQNNVFGTRNAALAARDAKVENFILISTDKAVRPTNFMGASKRIAELILQNLSEAEHCATRFSMVRFGNVLGSSGSVVPLFKQQILEGGPVTVTHPEVNRFFMTIPEAVQLVIQASAMGKGGDVFVLDMGEPVRISKLAESMIRLMGKTIKTEDEPKGDIEITYTGLRPGEKLYEELLIGENCIGTDHPMITRAQEHSISTEALTRALEAMDTACREFDHRALLDEVQRCVPEYQSSLEVFDYLANSPEIEDQNVIEFQIREAQ